MISGSRFATALFNGNTLILGSGLATELENQGHRLQTKLWSGQILIENPDAIVSAHLAYLKAGTHIITTASYQLSTMGLLASGLTRKDAQDIIISSVNLAGEARSRYIINHSGTDPLIAASIDLYGAFLGDGSEYTGKYGVGEDVIEEFHAERLYWLGKSDADILACETVPSYVEALVLNKLLMEVETPCWVSFSCKDGKHICDGTPIIEAIKLFENNENVLALGVNCTSPDYVLDLIKVIRNSKTSKKIIIYPNSDEIYEAKSKPWKSLSEKSEFANTAIGWRNHGAAIVGGCCQIGPNEIADFVELVHKQ